MERVKPPRQARSVRSAARFARAAEKLMRRRPLAEVTVAEIVAAAGMSTGAFYARFATKDALLDKLCEDRLSEQAERLAAELRARAAAGAATRELVETFVAGNVRFFVDNAPLLREVTLQAARPGTGNLPATRQANESADAELLSIVLGQSLGGRSADVANACSFITTFVAAMLRSYVLFPGTLPLAERSRSLSSLCEELVEWILSRLRAAA